MNIYKNFLQKADLEKLHDYMMSDYFPWYYNDQINYKGDGHFQFTYLFMKNEEPNCNKATWDLLTPILSQLKFKNLMRVKANLLLQTPKIEEHHFHIDQPSGTTGIFYINDNNGYTKFEEGTKVKSEKNKYVEFDSKLKHTGTTCTDARRRVVINFNYQ